MEATRKALSLSELEACVKHYILLIKGGGAIIKRVIKRAIIKGGVFKGAFLH